MAGGDTRFRGIFGNLPTALTADGGAIDETRMREHVDWLVDEGVHGISCLLSAGGFAYLTGEERTAVVGCVVEAVSGRVPVLAGVSAPTTRGTIELAKQAGDVGADALMVEPLSYVPLTVDEMRGHFQTVADAIDVPIGVYNNPRATRVDISPEQHVAIVRETGAVAAKDSFVGLQNVPAIVRHVDPDYGYLWAEASLLVPALQLGARGCCTSMASVFPREIVAIHDAVVEDGDIAAAHEGVECLAGVMQAMRALGGIRSVLAAAELRGHPLGAPRPPLQPAPREGRERLREAMAAAGLGPA